MPKWRLQARADGSARKISNMVYRLRLVVIFSFAFGVCHIGFDVPLASSMLAASPSREEAARLDFFEKQVRPILVDNCYTCHSADTNTKGGLRVDDRNGLLAGGESGPAVVPGKPDESLLIRAVRHTDKSLEMPPKKQLSAEQIAALTKWVADGAAWPQDEFHGKVGEPNAEYEKLRKEHWAWQSWRDAKVPQVRDAAWPRDVTDRFILAALEKQGLAPVRDAEKLALIRRTTFDLTGLPPTPEEVDAFLADAAADAFDRLVDRLLASPAFGERWARHWLDVARYGESTGPSRNIPYPHAWRYRDYVINAFNSDKPYDQFITEQIAGDLLLANSQQEQDERRVATGFLALGVKDVNQRFKVRFVMDNIDEQIDAVSRAVLALTASCARCHDHKFDPIPTADYYALAGIFQSSDLCAGVRNKMGGGGFDYYDTQMLLVLGPEKQPDDATKLKVEQAQAELKKARAELLALSDDPDKNVRGPEGESKLEAARKRVNKLQKQWVEMTDPAAGDAEVALGVREATKLGDTEIRIRGEAEKLGPVVQRGFLSVLQFPDQPQVNPHQSGRLELAQWLTSKHNPLTPRVMVNRVWQHLFGQGLVRSVDNFGVTGDVPSHPELLDHLAAQFVSEGWSIKKLVRRLVLSRTYQLSSDSTPEHLAVDPANRLLWRHSPRRLDAEEIRDATLFAAGQLELSRPKASPTKDLKVVELPNNGPEARRLEAAARATLHRSIYLPLLRDLTPTALEVFDFAQQGMVTGSRDTTTVAPQALYLLNDPFVRRQSLAMANRLFEPSALSDAARIQSAYRFTLGRTATPEEVARDSRYLAEYESALRENAASALAAADPKPKVEQADVPAPKPAAKEPAPATSSAPDPVKVPAAVRDPDEVVPGDAPLEDSIQPADPRAAAWASFCQALMGSAEFRYLK
jgi:hypothetical protein